MRKTLDSRFARNAVASLVGAGAKKIAEAARSRILARVAAAVPGSEAINVTDSTARPNFDAITLDSATQSERKSDARSKGRARLTPPVACR